MILLNYKFNKHIDNYIKDIESGKIKASKRLKKAIILVKKDLSGPDMYIDNDKIKEAKRVIELYFGFGLLPWQMFIISLIHCYKVEKDGTLVLLYDEFLILMGRGNGKTGFLSALIWYLTTHVHNVKEYNVDIIANNEEQAKTSFIDVFNMLENNWSRMKKGFHKTKEVITSKTTGSTIRYNTSNSKTKDGKRSACLVFDEIHAYETYDSIDVFKSGFGKRPYSRAFYITTNGHVRGGVLDKELKKSDEILDGIIKDMGFLPLIYEMDSEEEVQDPNLWEKANPSIQYFPDLKREINKHFINSKYQTSTALEFMTKRMNIPKQDNFTIIAEWDKILATNKSIPYEELKGATCIGSIDYAQLTDFCSVGLLFKIGHKRVFMEHTFVNHKSLKIEGREIKFPVEEMVDKGLITIVHDEFIRPKHLIDWFLEKVKDYNITDIFADAYRVNILNEEFEKVGLPLSTVRSGTITHSMIAPKIEILFADENLILGDNPTMRWYINNTYKEIDKKGNTTFLKIEPKTRKTDGFFSLLHAISQEENIPDSGVEFFDMDLIKY